MILPVQAPDEWCSAPFDPETLCHAPAILVDRDGNARCGEHVPELEHLYAYGFLPEHASPIRFAEVAA